MLTAFSILLNHQLINSAHNRNLRLSLPLSGDNQFTDVITLPLISFDTSIGTENRVIVPFVAVGVNNCGASLDAFTYESISGVSHGEALTATVNVTVINI